MLVDTQKLVAPQVKLLCSRYFSFEPTANFTIGRPYHKQKHHSLPAFPGLTIFYLFS